MDLKKEDHHQQLVPPCSINKSKVGHSLGCLKQPSNCSCVAWISARSPVEVKPVRPGMWILCHEKQRIDEIWKKIITLLSKNQLGFRANVSTNKKGYDKHWICLYNYDFEDVQDVFRVLVTLQRNHLEDEHHFEYHTVEKCVPMYISPPMINNSETEFRESIVMYQNNTEPEFECGLVAELKKNFTKYSKDNDKDVIKFYNPPKMLPSFSSRSRPCKYDELYDKEDHFHEPDCNKQPSTCYCEHVTWIWAFQLVRVSSIRSGKWLLFPEKKNVDEVWEKVKILLAANRLGNGAKVSKGEPGNEYLICIYSKDFENVQDVFRVLVALRRNHLQDTFIHYKTDEATLAGVYKSDEAAQRRGFESAKKLEPGRKISKYFSPPSPIDPTGATELIQLFLNNIGPEFKKGLVAELKKGPRDIEAQITFYNPPRILHPSLRFQSFVPKRF